MNKPASRWTLEELSQEVEQLLRRARLLGSQGDARVSAAPDARTVRYYATLGLLDRPELEGRVAVYGKKQLLQLVAIKALQAEGLGLSDIQSRLFGRSERELETLAEHLIARVKDAPPPAPQVRSLSEVVLAPGLVLVADQGFAERLEGADADELDRLETQFRAALAAIANARKGRGSKP